jgi:hypothetical protein
MPQDTTEDDEFAKDYLKLSEMLRGGANEAAPADDRVAAIVSAAYIEKYLVDVLARYFPGLDDNPVLKKAMFNDFNGMAGSLGLKLQLARALNAITPGTHEDGVTISKIRNKFAHNLEVTSFDHPMVADLTDNLWKRWSTNIVDDPAIRAEFAPWDRSERFRYVASCTCVAIMHLHIKEHPFSYSNGAAAIGTGARPPWLDKLNKPPRREE